MGNATADLLRVSLHIHVEEQHNQKPSSEAATLTHNSPVQTLSTDDALIAIEATADPVAGANGRGRRRYATAAENRREEYG